MNDRLVKALWAGGVPALTGIAVTSLHLLTNDDVFALAGIATIFVGTAVNIWGWIQFLSYRRSIPRSERNARYSSLALILLIGSYPLAFACLAIGLHSVAQEFVLIYIDNASGSDIREASVTNDRHDPRLKLGMIAEGTKTSTRFYPETEGGVYLSYLSVNGPVDCTLTGYITGGMKIRAEVRIEKDSTCTVSEDGARPHRRSSAHGPGQVLHSP